ncbi:mitochondrial inner membrane protease subunit 2 [Ambystoma mexicanum]|uniref:mitochondrial inner membrane protease subunit 2 n=1 Tax=Ambystoma mexicanum TaxID=8296 RepID=UPI0037E873E4
MAKVRGWRALRSFTSGFLVAVPVTVAFLDRVACVARVEGSSMQPALNPHGSVQDVVLLNRWRARHGQVQRGDVVSLLSPRDPRQKLIKRLIALEGDIVQPLGARRVPLRIPRGHAWVEGDHRGHSFDSNAFGPVPLGLLHAQATHILWPPERWRRLPGCLPPEREPLKISEK